MALYSLYCAEVPLRKCYCWVGGMLCCWLRYSFTTGYCCVYCEHWERSVLCRQTTPRVAAEHDNGKHVLAWEEVSAPVVATATWYVWVNVTWQTHNVGLVAVNTMHNVRSSICNVGQRDSSDSWWYTTKTMLNKELGSFTEKYRNCRIVLAYSVQHAHIQLLIPKVTNDYSDLR